MPDIIFLDFNTVSPSIPPEGFVLLRNAARIICLSPAADYWAELNGLNCESVDVHFDPGYLREKGLENYATVEVVCKVLDGILINHCGLADLVGRNYPGPAFGYYYKLKIIFDALVIRHHALSNILTTYRPLKIHYYYDGLGGFRSLEDIVFQNSHSLYFDLLNYLSNNKAFYFYPIEVTKTTKGKTHIFRRLLSISKARKVLTEILRMRANRRPSSSSKNLLVLSVGYDWSDALRLMMDMGSNRVYYMPLQEDKLFNLGILTYYFVALREIAKRNRKKEISDKASSREFLEKILALRSSFPLENIFFEIMVPYFQEVLFETERLYRQRFQHTKDILKKHNISALLTLFVNTPVNFMRIKAAKELNIPVAVSQHGGVGFDRHPIYYWGETIIADHMLLYGPALKPYYRALSRNRRIDYHITGSPLLDKAVMNSQKTGTGDPGNKKCVYILNVLAGNTHYLGHKNYRSDIFLWKFHKELSDIFSKIQEWSLIIKPHHNRTIYNPIADYILDQGIKNVIIDYRSSDDDLMQKADLVILDYPATSLIKAIAMKKEIIVFSGYFTIEKILQKRLEKMLFVSARKEEFFAMVQNYLEVGHSKRNNRLYDEFLSDYGTFLNDGKSTMRIKEALENILSEKQWKDNA